MQRTYSYDVVALDRPSVAGDNLFTVVETVDGVCRGGDHHWVRERYAHRAADLYRALADASADLPRGILACHHGAPSDVCGAAYLAITGTPMFDADPLVATSAVPS